MLNGIINIATRRWRRIFPERQIYIRSHGQVRYVTFPPVVQLAVLITVTLSGIWIAIASINFIYKDEKLAARDQQIKEIQGAYAGVSADMAQIQQRFLTATLELEAKHRQLAGLVNHGAQPALKPGLSKSPNQLLPASAKPVLDKKAVGEVFDGNVRALEARLADVKHAQSGLILSFAKDADITIVALEKLIAQTGLDVAQVVRHAGKAAPATGGPLIPAPNTASKDAPGFHKLSTSLERLEMLRETLFSLPLAAPVSKYSVSSGYGYRRDPFTRARAFHSGIDLVAPRGEPVFASGPGIVIFSGRNGPYGNMIEIDHGQGIHSRYGHLSKINIARGDKVGLRDLIGLVGSTGRSGTPHLHYEVWFDGKPRNPGNFLKAGRDVFQRQG